MSEEKNQSTKVVTRFAPSPTGFIHIGNLRTALFAFLWARHNNGTFILRIEDTDKDREVAGSVEHIKEALKWLGLIWDEGPDKGGPHAPYLQSERLSQLDIYSKYARRLIDSGFAYVDSSTEEEINALRKLAEANKKPFLYRAHRPENSASWQAGMPLRFKIKEAKRSSWHDAVRGDLTAGPEALDDFVLVKSDGYPTYNFAHIVDDIEMGVTHVIRGEEFISSTPNYLAVYEALQVAPPVFATMPSIQREDKTRKLSKRDGAKDVLEYRKEGYLPEALVNFLALIGWNPGGEQEIFSREELISSFDLTKVQKSGGAFNEEKLQWMNKEYMKKLSPEERANYALRFLPEPWKNYAELNLHYFNRVLPLILERCTTFGEITSLATSHELDFLWLTPRVTHEGLRTTEHLPHVISVLEELPEENYSIDELKAKLWDFATEKGRGEVLWPMRFALTGREKSPDPFTVAALIGKDETLKRLRHAAEL